MKTQLLKGFAFGFGFGFTSTCEATPTLMDKFFHAAVFGVMFALVAAIDWRRERL